MAFHALARSPRSFCANEGHYGNARVANAITESGSKSRELATAKRFPNALLTSRNGRSGEGHVKIGAGAESIVNSREKGRKRPGSNMNGLPLSPTPDWTTSFITWQLAPFQNVLPAMPGSTVQACCEMVRSEAQHCKCTVSVPLVPSSVYLI